MGAAGSVHKSKEDALAAGHSQEEIDAYLTTQNGESASTDSAAVENSTPTTEATSEATKDTMTDATTPEAASSDGVAIVAEDVPPKASSETTPATNEAASDDKMTVVKAANAEEEGSTATESDKTVGFVLEFSSSVMASGRPTTSKRAPARFRNRPPTSRRPPKKAVIPAKKQKPAKIVGKTVPETADESTPTEPAKPPGTNEDKGADKVAYKAIEEIFETTRRDSQSAPDSDVTRQQLLDTLGKHETDPELCTKLGLPSQKEGEAKTSVSAFKNAYDEYVSAFTEKKHAGKSTVDEVATFLTKHKNSVLRLLNMAS